jgi:diaminohydroxyphosphoribosylaminopyrimidine deaminase/5-amino-6-(5-phosphoribosylamino)uracil reductase
MADSDEEWMTRVLAIARRGAGRVSPNPMVGALLVRAGRIVGRGYHRKAGGPHAEIYAIREAGEQARGGTLFLNLEPCCHSNKRTPPCTEAILGSGIRKVVVAMRDPNPLVNGKGLRALRRNGIEVREGVLRKEAGELNEIFSKYIRTGFPFVALKIAATLDGKIALRSGRSRWITGAKARRFGHLLRSRYDAILVGKGTVLADNPKLTARTPGKSRQNPVRIILDEDLALPLASRVFSLRKGDQVIVASTKNARSLKKKALERKGVTVLTFKGKKGRVPLTSLLEKVGKLGISSVLIEGGSEVNGSAVRERVIDKVYYLVAMKLMGGSRSVPAIGGVSPKSLTNLPCLANIKTRKFGEDLLIEGYLKNAPG